MVYHFPHQSGILGEVSQYPPFEKIHTSSDQEKVLVRVSTGLAVIQNGTNHQQHTGKNIDLMMKIDENRDSSLRNSDSVS